MCSLWLIFTAYLLSSVLCFSECSLRLLIISSLYLFIFTFLRYIIYMYSPFLLSYFKCFSFYYISSLLFLLTFFQPCNVLPLASCANLTHTFFRTHTALGIRTNNRWLRSRCKEEEVERRRLFQKCLHIQQSIILFLWSS